MRWQPIDTAPKDDTRILACGRPGVFIVRWSHKAQFEAFNTHPGWQVFECEDGFYSWAFDPETLTHWMPLPKPADEAQE